MGLKGAKIALRQAFETLPWRPDLGQDQRLYLVGGTWRALARALMVKVDYPLRVVHRYALDGQALRRYTKQIIRRPADRLDAIKAVSATRRRKLPWAALAARELVRAMGAKRIVFSAAGVREGFGADLLGRDGEFSLPQHARYDQAIAALIPDGGRFGATGPILFDWMMPLFQNRP